MRSKTKIPKCLCQNYTNTKARYVVHNDTGGSYTGHFLCKNAHFKSFYDISVGKTYKSLCTNMNRYA